MNLQKRLARLEDNQKRVVSSEPNPEVIAEMNQIIQSLNDGTFKRRTKPWVICPVPPYTASIQSVLNKIAERKLKNQGS